MTISVWRYSHLALAVSSFLFIALAAITGCILAFEPLSQKTQPYRTDNFSQITVAQTLPAIKKNFTEIIDVTVDANQFVIVKGIDTAGNDAGVYVNARTGQILGEPEKPSEFFQWVTTLHRSLFLHETGRIVMGVVAFLLFLIATSGMVLVIQRQKGLKRFFNKIVKEDFAKYYHVLLGRLLLIPIIIISATGTWLTLDKYNEDAEVKIKHNIDFDALKSEPVKKLTDFAVFKTTKLADVQTIEFPFSEDVEDYFTLKLKDREIVVNQITGEVISEVLYPKKVLLANLSLSLHTGRDSFIWALVLAVASANILFFIYSGFVITLKRRTGRIKNKYKASESKFIILVGSEGGSTFTFARAIHQQLIKSGEKSFITELNNYNVFARAEHIVVLTATYGLGDAPTNAAKFIKLLDKHPQPNTIKFSVLGFGSKAYPDFCRFAFEANNALSAQPWATPLLEIHTVNDRSPAEFSQWAALWSQMVEVPVEISPDVFKQDIRRLQTLSVLEKTDIVHPEETFMVRMKTRRSVKFRSGDLLAIYPANDHRERLYSIGKIGKDVQLSVRMHEHGLGSGFLNGLNSGDVIKAKIVSNAHFYFPDKASRVILISNGTGIAPFLGMIDSNSKKIDCHLYCGFPRTTSFDLYQQQLLQNKTDKKLSKLNVAYSREGEKQYVKHLLERDAGLVFDTLHQGGTLMLCGSLSMQKDVIALLETICHNYNGHEVSYYQGRGQILMDCY
ncbi:PepSY domain-containing protein [Mucilaginibacter sp. JRF]|uniref:PepSY domain-containing protein n=1 Tax=Mucilaginibacter sp. JRF TaxID=2780088 RepID=UPI00187FD502|nr:PepSY domain-containing protein [Mucilaginibacter sp. JRF]MBE9586400.1 PepSY domain-containing protein [Mucilaginibacter sp. JRF]